MIVAVLRVVADPTRICLIEGLNERMSSTGRSLTGRLGMTQQAVSQQLGVLHQAGMVGRRRDGAWVHYELVDWTGWWLIEQLVPRSVVEIDDDRTGASEA